MRMKILIVGKETDAFHHFGKILQGYPHIQVLLAESGRFALGLIMNCVFDLIISFDELSDLTGPEFVTDLIMKNPALHVAVVSDLPSGTFRKSYDGLGVLGQIPLFAESRDLEDLFNQLSRIKKTIAVS